MKMASLEDHRAVVAMQKRGSSVSEISKTLKLHREQVHRVISSFGETGGIENCPSGRIDRTAMTLSFETPSKANCGEILKEASDSWPRIAK
ncbi:hypothetical protein Y032_0035g3020 [Ancylostoma ceylanicum]|uniref:Paired domain-containing protein n=1 Tax=Ancylostoma ceylanicum TaxID=53326 RepID=A0A016UKG6_9BILA|nr:hypothetical protein Y032_0035g3020 [Ancylostoma ceylanicum]